MSVWYKNEVSIQEVYNITPEELNTPDYDGQKTQASIAVFIMVVKIKKVATASGNFYQHGKDFKQICNVEAFLAWHRQS